MWSNGCDMVGLPSTRLRTAQGKAGDTGKPPPPGRVDGLLFDGLINVYGTCRDCRQIMTIIDPSQHCHPCCDPSPPTRLESLLTGWLSCIMAGDEASAELTAQEIDQIKPSLPGAAILYTTWGWPVFPLSPRSKQPAIPKKQGGQGFKQATADTERITRWWDKHPDHNIGLPTGHRFDVIDIDPKKGGAQSFLELLPAWYEKPHPIPDVHGIAVTASGGMHLYMRPTGKPNFADLRPGIDYRGKGGYVVAPPSTLGAPGRDYAWLIQPSPMLKGDNDVG
jgi:hypothetical protein